MYKLLLSLIVILTLSGCENKYTRLGKINKKMTDIEYTILVDYSYSHYKILYAAIGGRLKRPTDPRIPFCDLTRYIHPNSALKEKIMTIVTKEEWDTCHKQVNSLTPRSLNSPITPDPLITVDTLKELTRVAQVCMSAKVAIIRDLDVLDEAGAIKIIKKCQVYKLHEAVEGLGKVRDG